MRAHESLCDREAEARAAGRARPRFVVAPEELEHALRGERREPLPRVLDCNDDVVGVRLDDDGDRAVVGRVPDRVREQVQQDTLDLVRGDAHARRRAFKARLEPDVPRPSLCVERTHAAGDELLVAVADRLRKSVRPSDAIARLGGDEFAVMVKDTGDVTYRALDVAERILKAFQRPVAVGERQINVHLSVGVATTRESRRADELIRNADLAMYRAKDRGKGQSGS